MTIMEITSDHSFQHYRLLLEPGLVLAKRSDGRQAIITDQEGQRIYLVLSLTDQADQLLIQPRWEAGFALQGQTLTVYRSNRAETNLFLEPANAPASKAENLYRLRKD